MVVVGFFCCVVIDKSNLVRIMLLCFVGGGVHDLWICNVNYTEAGMGVGLRP
jgi:hypothetical protein